MIAWAREQDLRLLKRKGWVHPIPQFSEFYTRKSGFFPSALCKTEKEGETSQV